jgi:hypothetical protein
VHVVGTQQNLVPANHPEGTLSVQPISNTVRSNPTSTMFRVLPTSTTRQPLSALTAAERSAGASSSWWPDEVMTRRPCPF